MPVSDDEITELWIKYCPIVKGHILGKIQNSTAVEDITGEVFLGFIEMIKKNLLRDEKKIGKVLLAITRRKIYDWLRNKYKEQRLASIFPSSGTFSGPKKETVSREYEIKELSNHVMISVSHLTDRQQQAFVLMVIQNMSRADAAKKLNVSESRMQHLIGRAKELVAEDLAEIYLRDPDNGRDNLSVWLDKFYNAYLRLALKTGRLNKEFEKKAVDAWMKIKHKLEKEK